MKFDKDGFIEFLARNSDVFKSDTIASGRKSSWYFDSGRITNDVFLMNRLVGYIMDYVADEGLNPSAFVGVPEGATKLGIVLQDRWAKRAENYGLGSHVLPMMRVLEKKHGRPEDRVFIGTPPNGTIVVEDVTTTGTSLIGRVNSILKKGITDIGALVLLDRNHKDTDIRGRLKKLGVPFYIMTIAQEFLPAAYRIQKPREEVARAVEEEMRKYGAGEIKLL